MWCGALVGPPLHVMMSTRSWLLVVASIASMSDASPSSVVVTPTVPIALGVNMPVVNLGGCVAWSVTRSRICGATICMHSSTIIHPLRGVTHSLLITLLQLIRSLTPLNLSNSLTFLTRGLFHSYAHRTHSHALTHMHSCTHN